MRAYDNIIKLIFITYIVGVSLMLLEEVIPNNSLVNLDDLAYQSPSAPVFMEDPTNANGRQTLMCVTDPCSLL